LATALEAAEIDAKYKIKATFAVQLSSPLYNPFTAANIRAINEIHQLGHNIALHHRIPSGHAAEGIKRGIIKEMQVMRAFFPYIQPVFVWHNLSLNSTGRNIEIDGMTNACKFAEKFYYISDSILKHKAGDFLAALDNHMLIQLLLHPTVWMSGRNSIVSMFAYALNSIIRECDHEFALNPAWKEKFPNGIPEESLSKLEAMLNG